jgi:hypothetical protein
LHEPQEKLPFRLRQLPHALHNGDEPDVQVIILCAMLSSASVIADPSMIRLPGACARASAIRPRLPRG